MNPGFSERTFEFCFNAEYCNKNAALLASHPHIPSQQAEKHLGYDVEFRLRQGGFTKSVFFQHKVSAFAEHKAGRNAKFYDNHNGPYFRFNVDNDQHNTLVDLSQNKGNAFYCAPCFHLSHQLENHFRVNSIDSNVILLDPLNVGGISDNKRHNITYNPQGLNATLHSESRRFTQTYSASKERGPILREGRLDLQYIEGLSELLTSRTIESRFEKAITPEVLRASPIQRAQYILGHIYQVSWILLP